MRVLVTGAAGSIGQVIVPGLQASGHQARGLDLVDEGPTCELGWMRGDCTDPAVARAGIDGVDAVVHLAGDPGEGSLAHSLTSHTVSTGTLLDAMVAAGVRRFVYASSNHAVGLTPHVEQVGVDILPRPDTFYGVAKVAAEAVLGLFADRHGISAVACRIGSFLPTPQTRRHLSTWLSPDDCVRMVDAGIRVEQAGLHVLYGISANTRAWWDLAPGRALGYDPRDDAEQWADTLPVRAEDEQEDQYVGGPFAGPAYTRPAGEA
jgi:uronate dehydrogenase